MSSFPVYLRREVLPLLQACLVYVSCVVVFVACILLIADVSSSSDDDAAPRRRSCGGRRKKKKSPRKRKHQSISHSPVIHSRGKENFAKQIVSDANCEMTSSIADGETSCHITVGKEESALTIAASPHGVFSIRSSCVGADNSYNLNHGQNIQHAGQLAAETVMINSCKNDYIEEADEHDSPSRRNSYIDLTPFSAESNGGPEICKTNMPLQESLKTRPTSQCTELVSDKSNSVAQTAWWLTVLVSNGVYDIYQASNQRATLSLLGDLGIPHDVVDGMDPSQKERRDAFFGISGIRGNYPQIFLTSTGGDEHHFLGGYDWLNNVDFKDLETIGVVGRGAPGKDEQSHCPVDRNAITSSATSRDQARQFSS